MKKFDEDREYNKQFARMHFLFNYLFTILSNQISIHNNNRQTINTLSLHARYFSCLAEHSVWVRKHTEFLVIALGFAAVKG